jgi:radical S-adenosyl methionine domain-containing protein 2
MDFVVGLFFLLSLVVVVVVVARRCRRRQQPIAVSVNYFFTRECNFQCGFCFHTAKSSFVLSVDEAKRGLRMLRDAGTRKINFAGGEPLMPKYHDFLGELLRHLKEDLLMESVSIVSNGSFLKQSRRWFEQYGKYIDILAISCDSADEATNKLIGRASGGRGKQLEYLREAKELCLRHDIKFKINTVVNSFTWLEDMNALIDELQPTRWKVFQVLILRDENDGADGTKRDATRFAVTDEQFAAFCARHRHQPSIVPESNQSMQNSYLLLDEHMCFLDCSRGGKAPTQSILKVGVERALGDAGFDETEFLHRGGMYDWTRSSPSSSCDSNENASRDMEDLLRE